jgi:hypothetical protein
MPCIKNKLLTTLLLICASGSTFACKCGDPGTVKEAYKYTSLIIHGKVISYEVVSLEETIKPDSAKAIRERLKYDSGKLRRIEATKKMIY